MAFSFPFFLLLSAPSSLSSTLQGENCDLLPSILCKFDIRLSMQTAKERESRKKEENRSVAEKENKAELELAASFFYFFPSSVLPVFFLFLLVLSAGAHFIMSLELPFQLVSQQQHPTSFFPFLQMREKWDSNSFFLLFALSFSVEKKEKGFLHSLCVLLPFSISFTTHHLTKSLF